MVPTLLLLLASTCLLPAVVKANKKVSDKLAPDCSTTCQQVQVVKTCTALPYHQLMTPAWLVKHATIIAPYSVNQQCLELLPSTTAYSRRLRLQLVAPKILTTTDCISVTIIVAVNTTLADSSDHDPSFGISDGKSFIGFLPPDKGNYNGSPCLSHEGDAGSVLQNRVLGNAPVVTSRSYSSEVKLQIRPTEQWGSCHTEHDEGYTRIANYQRNLDLTNGLYLEMYGADTGEKYCIKYIVVDINID